MSDTEKAGLYKHDDLDDSVATIDVPIDTHVVIRGSRVYLRVTDDGDDEVKFVEDNHVHHATVASVSSPDVLEARSLPRADVTVERRSGWIRIIDTGVSMEMPESTAQIIGRWLVDMTSR